MTPTTVRDNLKALSAHLLESTGRDFMYESVEQAIKLLGEREWQGIESAPKTGETILTWDGEQHAVICWDRRAKEWHLAEDGGTGDKECPIQWTFTHWQLPPEPPK